MYIYIHTSILLGHAGFISSAVCSAADPDAFQTWRAGVCSVVQYWEVQGTYHWVRTPLTSQL